MCFIPLIIVLPLFCEIKGILWAAPIADAIAMIVTIVRTVTFFASLKREEKQASALATDEQTENK